MLPAVRRRGWLEPFSLLRDMEREMERALRPIEERAGEEEEGLGIYPVDIREKDDAYEVEAELPGFERDQIDVTIEGNTLTIRAERKVEEKEGTMRRHERRFTRVERSFTLPANVDRDKVEGKLEQGVLHLSLPKSGEKQPHRIELK